MIAKKYCHLIWLGVALVSCTTVKNYDAQLQAGPAKPEDYPIYLYPQEIPVPRPYEVIGAMSIRDTPLTVFGGSFEGELKTLRKYARKKGADALKLTSVQQPDFLHAKYRVEANLIRFTNVWESVTLTEGELRAYFHTQAATLDPIEGIWLVNDVMQCRVGIMKNNSRAGRDFIAFILNTANPTWQHGDKKLDLASGERPGVYRGAHYLEDYRRLSVAFTLQGPRTNVFGFRLSDDGPPTVFTKE
jgi:hypothetical protein